MFRGKHHKKEMTLARGCAYSMNCYETQLNNNVIIVGSSGCGKTRSIVSPNIDKAYGSYVVLDPKGNLYEKHKEKLEDEGYVVKKLDFIHPEKSAHYNPFAYIKSPLDVKTIAHTFVYGKPDMIKMDPYWPESAEQLLTTLIGYICEEAPYWEQNMETLIDIISNMEIRDEERDPDFKSAVDMLFEEYQNCVGENWLTKGYRSFRNNAGTTARCVINTASSSIEKFNIPEVLNMLSYDEIDIRSIGEEKTALFVVVSDNDRSMDTLSSILFTQIMHELCCLADDKYFGELPLPVRFILDDFATNMKITDFPKMISSFRSRNISSMIIVQAEAQLRSLYGYDAETIITNCDTYVYLGGSDIETAQNIGARAGKRLRKILYMPLGRVWVFRRGSKPVYTKQNKPFVYERDMLDLYMERLDEIGKKYGKLDFCEDNEEEEDFLDEISDCGETISGE